MVRLICAKLLLYLAVPRSPILYMLHTYMEMPMYFCQVPVTLQIEYILYILLRTEGRQGTVTCRYLPLYSMYICIYCMGDAAVKCELS